MPVARRCWFTLASGLILLPCGLARAASTAPDSVLWYRKPAAIWEEALPLGNGRLGAMVFGGANAPGNNGDGQIRARNADIADGSKTRPQDEHLQLNESTVWQGSRTDRLNPLAHDGFTQARQLLLASHGTDASKIADAEKLLAKTMISNPPGMPGYSTLGDLYLRSSHDADAVSDYRRALDLNTGILRVSYMAGGTRFTREMFASAPDDVVVVHLTAERAGALSFAVSMDRPADFTVHVPDAHNIVLTQGVDHHDQINFQGQTRVVTKGGKVSVHGNSLDVDSADEVTLLFTAATDFKGGTFRGDPPAAHCEQILNRAATRSYADLRKAAIDNTGRWMQRVSLRLGQPHADLDALPTDERLTRVAAGGDDLGLQQLYFDFARYLLIGSSRPGGLPATLQGIWAGGINNPWGSKYTININTEMNYWMAEPADLGELHTPLFDLTDMLRTPGSGTGVEVAQRYYGAHGFVAHHNTDIWGDAHPIDFVSSGLWPMGGAWLLLHAWDHYAFTGDRAFLRTRAYPLLHDASLFFLDYLVDDGHGHLVTGPSISPENRYKLPDGSVHSIAMGPTMDIEIVRELFERTVQASTLLNTDSAFRSRIHDAMDRLLPFQVGHRGNLQEWPVDYDDAEPGHRHISHLWALFPGTQITMRGTPLLARAAQNTLEARLQNGGGQTGWSRAWVINYWDHLGNGEEAYKSMEVMLKQSTFPNMMDTHPPGLFQIDGNLGAANGMIEALAQSRWFPDHAEVDLLPALPSAWAEGELHGVRVRGGGKLDLSWAAGKVARIDWQCTTTGNFDLHLPAGQTVRAWQADGKPLPVPETHEDVVRMPMRQGTHYLLNF